MRGLTEVTATTRGTRPGDPVADALFNMAFRLVVLDARSKFELSSSFQFVGHPAPVVDLLHPRPMPREGFAEVSFVDDIAFAVNSDCPSKLVGSLQTIASCLHDAAASRGLHVNYSAGKTKAMVRLLAIVPKQRNKGYGIS